MKWLLSLVVAVPCIAQPVQWVQAWQNREAARIVAESLPENPEMATEWYWYEGQGGGGTGTDDYGDWATIDAGYAAGDTIWVNGASVYRGTIILNKANTTVKVVPSTGRWEVTGLQTLTAGSWSVHTTVGGRTIYKQSTGEAVTAFIYNRRWADVVDTTGVTRSLPIGRIPKTAQTTLANFITDITSNDRPSWFYNSTNQLIYVYFPSNDDPRSSGLTCEWCKDWNTVGFKVTANGVSVSGGYIHDFLPPTTADTDWMSQLSGVSGCTLTDNHFDGGFYHLTGSTGGISVDNIIEDCVFYTVARGTDGITVQYSNSGALTGGVIRGCTIHLSDLRDYNGDPLNMYASSAAIKGMAGHAGASGSIGANGLIYENCETIDYADCHASGGTQAMTSSGGNGTAPTNRWDKSQYAVVFRGCTLRASILGQLQDTAYTAFVRNYIYIDGSDGNGIEQANFNTLPGSMVLFEANVFDGKMDGTANWVLFRGDDKYTFLNNTVYTSGSTEATFFFEDGMDVVTYHNLWVRENAGNFCKGASQNQSTTVFNNDWYDVNYSDTGFSAIAAINTQAEWTSLIDPGGHYDVDFSSEFSSLVTFAPSPSGLVWTTHEMTDDPYAPDGINTPVPYGGTGGAWQLPSVNIVAYGCGISLGL